MQLAMQIVSTVSVWVMIGLLLYTLAKVRVLEKNTKLEVDGMEGLLKLVLQQREREAIMVARVERLESLVKAHLDADGYEIRHN